MAGHKSWDEIRNERALNEARVETYKRVMDAQERIAEVLLRNGVSDEQIEQALAASHPDGPGEEPEEEVYLRSLGRFVAALGGRLELQAVLPAGSVTILHTDTGGRLVGGGDQIAGSEAN